MQWSTYCVCSSPSCSTCSKWKYQVSLVFYIGDRDVVILQANFKFIIYKGKLSSGSMQYNGEYTKRVSSYFQRGKILFFPYQFSWWLFWELLKTKWNKEISYQITSQIQTKIYIIDRYNMRRAILMHLYGKTWCIVSAATGTHSRKLKSLK